MHLLNFAAICIFPLLAASQGQKMMDSMEDGLHAPYRSEWANPYLRRDQVSNLSKRDLPFGADSGFNIYFCRNADQTDCDRIPISASFNCYNNQQWHGWTTTARTPSSLKIDGPTCCALFSVPDCNKKAADAFEGYFMKICEGDTGDKAKVDGKGQMVAYMCNVPYGSAGKNMDKSPPNIIPIPKNLAPQQHN